MRPVLLAFLTAAALVAACERRSAGVDERPPPEPPRAASGQTLPLARILDIAADSAPGEVVKVELEEEHGVLAYELEIITGRGRLIEMRIDARTGAVLKREAE